MNRILVYVVLVCPLVLWGLTGLQATRGEPQKPAAPTQEVLLLTSARPVALDLGVRREGGGASAWDAYIDKLFAFLDADHDGVLSAKEWLCAPAAEQLIELTQDSEIVTAAPAPDFAEVAGGPGGTITRDKLAAYYQREGLGSITFEAGRRTGPDAVSEALWAKLDDNKDGKLSRAELRAADRLLRTADPNEDDLIQLSEILGRDPGNDFQFEAPVRLADALERGALVLRDGTKPAQIAPGLLRRLDRDKNGKLTRAEVGVERAVFERFDADHDDEWSAAELEKWLHSRPEARLELQLGDPKKPASVRLVADKDTPSSLRWDEAGRRLIVGERALVEFYSGPSVETMAKAVKERYDREFKALDTNKNGKLERAEVFKPPFSWVAIMRLVDADGDDVITRKELDTWLEVQQAAVTSVVTLTVADRGPSLFELLDRDRDGRLCPRELLNAWEVLRPWDRDGDNAIVKDEVPHQYHVGVTSGRWRAPNAVLPAPNYGRSRGSQSRGPMWFRKMDRNMDGDVSPREFLGSREAFRKLDRNNDGLIDAEEAEAASK